MAAEQKCAGGAVVGSQLPNEAIVAVDDWRRTLETNLALPERPTRSLVLKHLILVGLAHLGEAERRVKKELVK